MSWLKGRVGKAIALDAVGVDSSPNGAQKMSKLFWIFLGHIISSVHPTRWTRVVISSRFNRKILTHLTADHTFRQSEDESC